MWYIFLQAIDKIKTDKYDHNVVKTCRTTSCFNVYTIDGIFNQCLYRVYRNDQTAKCRPSSSGLGFRNNRQNIKGLSKWRTTKAKHIEVVSCAVLEVQCDARNSFISFWYLKLFFSLKWIDCKTSNVGQQKMRDPLPKLHWYIFFFVVVGVDSNINFYFVINKCKTQCYNSGIKTQI